MRNKSTAGGNVTDNEIERLGFAMLPNVPRGEFMAFAHAVLAQARNMTDRELLQQALDALGTCTPGDYSTGAIISPCFDEKLVNAAYDAIHAALAQPEAEPVDQQVESINAVFDAWRNGEDAYMTLGLATPQAQPAPAVARMHCNCEWEGETQVQQCTLHAAHVDAIHEWAERAKSAEARIAAPAVPAVNCEWTNCPHRVGDVCCNERPAAPAVPDAHVKAVAYALCEIDKHNPDELLDINPNRFVWQRREGDARYVLRAIAAEPRSAPAAPAVPNGWVMVPREPTQEMVQAAFAGKTEVQDALFQHRARLAMGANYRAMIAAAPGSAPAAPAVREPLTNTQLFDLLVSVDPTSKRLPQGFMGFARAVERAHGITGDSNG